MKQTFSYYPAPAKLNLMLHIVGRRPDGFHLLQTVFQFLDYCDELGFSLRDDGQICRVNELGGVPAENDLVIKAAGLLAAKMECCPGVDIELNKKIPMGGGLGGGSSDAATVLVVLNKLWGLSMELKELQRIGLSLGADVPVFVAGHAAWAEGVGEKLEVVELSEPWFVVIDPRCHVSTAEIFSNSDLTRNSPVTTIADFLANGGRNDCEKVVRNSYQAVARALDWLGQFSPSFLTGTGGCVFSSFPDQQSANEVLAKLPEEFDGFVARGLNRSPLLDSL